MSVRSVPAQPELAPPVLGALFERARETPRDPWLFHRRGLDWRWRSHARAAEQVAAGIERLRPRSGTSTAASDDVLVEPPRLGLHADHRPASGPDDLAAALAILGSGRDLDLSLEEASLLVRVEGAGIGQAEPGTLELPACRGELDRPAPALETPEPGRCGSLVEAGGASVSLERVEGLAQGLERALPAELGVPSKLGAGERPVVFATALLDLPRFFALAAWTLRHGAAWALEPQADAFVPTALWTRPSVLVATPAELELLSTAFDGTARGRSRLRAVVRVAVEGTAEGGPGDAGPGDTLGVPVVAW